MLYNNWQLQVFASHLFDYPLPPHTILVARHASVGLEGNGNHCDFRVWQEMLTGLTQAEIEAYYQSVRLPPVNDHNESWEPEFQGRPLPVIVDFAPTSGTDHQRVTVSLYDYGYAAGFDLRCN